MCLKYAGIDKAFNGLLHNDQYSNELEKALYDKLMVWGYIK